MVNEGGSRTPRRYLGTAARLSGYLALLLALVLGVSAWATWLSFSQRTTRQATADLVAELQDFKRAISQRGSTPLPTWTVQYLSLTVLPAGESVVVDLPNHLRYGSTGAGALLKDPAIDALLTSPPSTTDVRTVSTASGPVLALATPIVEGTEQVGSFLAVYDLSSLRADQRHVLVLALIEAAVALIAAVLGTYLLLRRLLGTIGSMTSTARAIEEGDLDQRLGDPGTDDEVAELAATLDAMLDRIDEVMSVQRQLLSDVSHQLRTPLTVVRGHLEVMGRTSLDDPAEIREVIEMLVGEVDHMGQLTEQLLLLGRSLEPDFVTTTPTDLRSFIGDIGAAAMVLAEGRFTLGSIDDLVIDVDETKLRGAILNLIDNAVKAIGPADQVRLSAYRVDGTGPVLIHVEDSGPGISPEVRARVLERFGRLDTETRSGSGLGLAIVRAVAEAHGGTFELGTSALGGLDATIVLPDDLVTVDGRTKEEHTS